MENVLAAIAIYFALPFLLGGLAILFGAIVDGLIWLIHGTPVRAQTELPPAPAPLVPIPLARLSPA